MFLPQVSVSIYNPASFHSSNRAWVRVLGAVTCVCGAENSFNHISCAGEHSLTALRAGGVYPSFCPRLIEAGH